MKYDAKNKFMQMAIEEAREGINKGHGGPFGAVIVKDGKVIAKGHNEVIYKNDPTCHGEMQAIRKACKKLKTYNLSGCEIYTTGEPCHMCLSAIIWAKIDKIYYGCSIKDNAKIGFRDKYIDSLFGGREKLQDVMEQVDRDACVELFDYYLTLDNKKY